MTGSDAIQLLVGLLPVLLFLLALLWLDSFKLVGLRAVLATLVAGGAAAGLAYLVHLVLLAGLPLDFRSYSRYVSPPIEETLKSLVIVWILLTQRAGFLIDAAILGFAAGTGFALVENAYYWQLAGDGPLTVWLLRGFGTAVMHGGTTAIFAIVAKALSERAPRATLRAFGLAWGLAVLLHAAFNHFPLSPVLSALLVLVGLPPLLVLVFRRGEIALRDWLGVGFDADAELLELIHSGGLGDSRVGRYLDALRERFRGEVIVDMLCYLRLHLELSLRAKGELMMREAGFKTRLEPEIQDKLEELRYLERSIGHTGRLALAPFLHAGGKALWQLRVLGAQPTSR